MLAFQQLLLNILNGVILFRKDFGFEENSNSFTFDSDKLKNYHDSIKFLYGQLDSMKNNPSILTPQNAILKYDNSIWTKNPTTLMKLFSLGTARGFLTPFNAHTKSANILLLDQTLSPKDPNFAEWFKGYEAKMKKADGPTPDEK